MKKLASNLPLQDMIRSVVANATEKLAADEKATEKKVQKLVAYEKKEHGGHIPSVHEEEVEEKEHQKTASAHGGDYIEKLASAVDYIAANVDSIEPAQPSVLEKAIHKFASEEGSPVGPGKGPGALEVSKAIGGQQSHKKDHPKTEDAAESETHSPMNTHGLPGAKTLMENNMPKPPGPGKFPHKGPLVAGPSAGGHHKTAASAARAHILQKLAGEDVMKANISASRSSNPLAGMGELTTTDSSQSSPHQAGDETGGHGNQGRRLIASNKAAIDATKGDAKGPVKTQLKEVLEEPALNPGTDSTLKNNLRNTGKAGVKIAAVKAALTKIASEGCQCTGNGECSYCQLKSAVKVKTANAMQGYGGGGGAMMGGTPPPNMPTGGMSSMANAGAGADGCTCGGTGECRVCKLKAALAAAKAGHGDIADHGGGVVEKDSTGDAMTPSGMY